MAFDPSLMSSQSDSSVLRSDHHTAHTPSTIHSNRDNSSLSIAQSTTSPTVLTPQSYYMDSPSAKDDHLLNQPSISPVSPQNPSSINDEDSQALPSAGMTFLEVDPQIIEALKGKDRIYVLKLGETFEALITERRTRVELTAATSYQRLLVHRCSAYYKLAPESDPVTKGIFVLSTVESRIPDRRISELVPAEATTQPAFKIMRRSVLERRTKPQSHNGSVAGEDADLSDVEPSEAGSIGGRSINSASTKKHRMTIEEREAAYNEARSRIFMDFEEKEKSKEKDMSASSSSLSLTGSASTSAGGRSNVSDTDDAASSPATESEWSVPSASHSRDKKDNNRRGHPNGSTSSNRPLRNGGSFHTNGSGGSSRNSRAPSPSFSYASLHDASPAGHIYDPSHHQSIYYQNQYPYPYSPPAQGPGPYMNPYPYYPAQYNPYPPPKPQHGPSDPAAAPGPESFPPQQMNYAPHYGWSQPPPIQSPPHNMHMPLSPHPPPPQNQPPSMNSPPLIHPQQPHYPPFPPPHHAYPYAMNTYYPSQQPAPPPPGQQMQPPLHMNMNLQHPQTQTHQQQPHHQQQQPGGYDVPRVLNGNQMGHPSNGQQFINQNGNGPRAGLGNGIISPNNNNARVQGRNVIGYANGINGPKNGNGAQMPLPGRSAWSYGPGVGNGGHTVPSHVGEALGPRFQLPRHASGNSSSGGNSRSSTCDDATSTSSSTTSSSSRRTYTSTTSSQQHPLPARPDWAVGLRAQPTLAGGRHLDHSRNISPISPPRSSSNGGNSPLPLSDGNSPRNGSQHTPSVSLQSTDFPPLTSTGGGAAAEKKTPVVSGAWGQSRPILSTATNGNVANTPSNPGSVQQSPIVRQEEGMIVVKPGEIINPKLVRRPQQNTPAAAVVVNGQNAGNIQRAQQQKDGAINKNDVTVSLAGQVASMTIHNGEGNGIVNGGGIDASALSTALNDAAAASSSPASGLTTSLAAPSVSAPSS